MTATETEIRRGDRVRHKDGTEGVAMMDAVGGLVVVQVAEVGLVEWRSDDLTVLGPGPGGR